MKKLITLFMLTAGMVFGSFTGAQAIDWKIRGAWYMEFGVYEGLTFMRETSRGSGKTQYGPGNKGPSGPASGDTFNAAQRVDIWIDAVASESLSASLRLEIGPHQWGWEGAGGTRTVGGAMGQRGVSVAVRYAFIDWFVPGTALSLRMGIQPIVTPSYTFGANVLGNDIAGITASYKFNDNISLTAFWARPFNNNYTESRHNGNPGNTWTTSFGEQNTLDNIDLFALLAPLSFNGFKATPWVMMGALGPNTFRSTYSARGRSVVHGMFPGHWQTSHKNNGFNDGYGASKQYATAWWAGLTGEISAADPFRFAWDAVYGSVTRPDASHLNRRGWYINALAEYKLDWGVPGLYGWWGSGDDSNPKNGSERMPVFDIWLPPNNLSTFGFTGYYRPYASPDGIFGLNAFAGTWGIGARIRDMSFLTDLRHTLRVNFFGGTNSPQMAKYILGKKTAGARGGFIDDFNSTGGLYLTTQDYGLELNLDSSYKIYENLEMIVSLGYIHLWLDQSRAVWGADPHRGLAGAGNGAHTRGVSVTDALKAALYFQYSF